MPDLEVIPPSEDKPLSFRSLSHNKKFLLIGGGAAIFTWALWCINEFTSIRGVNSVLASRIILGVLWLLLLALGMVVCWGLNSRTWRLTSFSLWAIVSAALLIAADHWAPKPSGITQPPRTAIPIYPPFQSLYSKSESRLGRPLSRGATVGVASYEVYQRATIIWTREFGKHYILHTDGSFRTKEDSSPAAEDEWFDEAKGRILFPRTPAKLHPPIGSIRKFWLNEPSVDWEGEIGYLDWYCDYPGEGEKRKDGIYIQHFEHGVMIGVMPEKNPMLPGIGNLQGGMVFAIFDASWEHETRPDSHPPEFCEHRGWRDKQPASHSSLP